MTDSAFLLRSRRTPLQSCLSLLLCLAATTFAFSAAPWEEVDGALAIDRALDVVEDGSGNLYMTGYAAGPLAGVSSPLGQNLFVGKYASSTGVMEWGRLFGSDVDHQGEGIAIDGSGDILVAGMSYGTWGTPLSPYTGMSDLVMLKLDSDGNLLWNTFMGSAGADYVERAAADEAGNAYIVGTSRESWGTPVNAHSGNTDVVVAKLASDGTLLWHTFLGGGDFDVGDDVVVDALGNVFVTGESPTSWGAPLSGHSGEGDVFVAKLNSSGALQWHTFLGGTGEEDAGGVGLDASGNVYAAGITPGSWGAPLDPYTGGTDLFVAKLNSSGARQWHTFAGGSANERCSGMAVEPGGDIYLTGQGSTGWPDPVNPAIPGSADLLAVQLDNTGALVWHTYAGGSEADNGNAITVDASLDVYVAGTYSGEAFSEDMFLKGLTSAGIHRWETIQASALVDKAYDLVEDGAGAVYMTGVAAGYIVGVNPTPPRSNLFVGKYASSTGEVLAREMFGGSENDEGVGIGIDGIGGIYLAGTSSGSWDAPIAAFNGGSDLMVLKVDSDLTLLWHTFLGSAGSDWASAAAVDTAGNTLVVGLSRETWGSPLNAHSGGTDVVVAKVASNGTLLWNTFLGGSDYELADDVFVDGVGNVYVTGKSPVTWGTPLNPHAGEGDVFVAQLNSSGVLEWHTFLGGTGDEYAGGVGLDAAGNVYAGGSSPGTWGVPLSPFTGGRDLFVAKLNSSGARQWHTFAGGSSNEYPGGVAVEAEGNIYLTGQGSYGWPGAINPVAGESDLLIVQLDDTGAVAWHTFAGDDSYDLGHAITLDSAYDIYAAGSYADDMYLLKRSHPPCSDADSDGYGMPGNPTCLASGRRDCDDSHDDVYPGAAEICDGLNNDCDHPGWPSLAGLDDGDDDGDGVSQCAGDCEPLDASTYPNAPESNDGNDNQCPGDDGYGLVDEIAAAGFYNAADPNEYSWTAQPGASLYQVARSTSPDFSSGCSETFTTTDPVFNDATPVAPGEAYYYLVRPLQPFPGSWGRDSDDVERVFACGLESDCDDGLDNDLDGAHDCDDPDCLAEPVCMPDEFTFIDTYADDIGDTAIFDFFNSLSPVATDYLLFEFLTPSGSLALCTARADFYWSNYLSYAPGGGTVYSGAWERWFRLPMTGGTWTPDSNNYPNGFGGACAMGYSWCPEFGGLFGYFRLGVHPPYPSLQCETIDSLVGCSDGTWQFTLKVGPNRLATCDF